MTVDFNQSSNERQIVDAVREVLAGMFPLSRFRTPGRDDGDTEALAGLTSLGWLGLGVDEAHGGAGLTLVEDALVFREFGRHLVSPNVLASSLGAHLALALGQDDLASQIIEGRTMLCLGTRRSGPRSRPGFTHFLHDAKSAAHCIIWDATQIAIIPRDAWGVVDPARGIDGTLSLGRVTLQAPPVLALVAGDACQLRRRADLLVAAYLLGVAEEALAKAVEYAGIRQQFGQPIGAFQAIKHRCADMSVRVRVLEAQVLMAALSEHERRPDAPLQVASARLLASRYALENASAGIQIHGAMGFTAECEAHLFLLRAQVFENLGSVAAERDVAMASLPFDHALDHDHERGSPP
jgi:alkylation response protein AidB-like acyl-CoA dehydrogenase